MKTDLAAFAIAALLGFAGPASADPGAQPEAPASPAGIVDAFAAALDAGDTAVLSAMLAHDVQIAESGGIERSLEEYRSHHMGADIEFAKAVETKVLSRQVYEGEGLTTVMTEAVSSGTFRGNTINSSLMETMVLKQTDGDWKIVHIHWSSASLAADHEH
jgi:ketosteroid isomerase-like protein